MFKLKKEATEYENKSLRLPKDLIDKVNKVVIQCIECALDNMEPE